MLGGGRHHAACPSSQAAVASTRSADETTRSGTYHHDSVLGCCCVVTSNPSTVHASTSFRYSARRSVRSSSWTNRIGRERVPDEGRQTAVNRCVIQPGTERDAQYVDEAVAGQTDLGLLDRRVAPHAVDGPRSQALAHVPTQLRRRLPERERSAAEPSGQCAGGERAGQRPEHHQPLDRVRPAQVLGGRDGVGDERVDVEVGALAVALPHPARVVALDHDTRRRQATPEVHLALDSWRRSRTGSASTRRARPRVHRRARDGTRTAAPRRRRTRSRRAHRRPAACPQSLDSGRWAGSCTWRNGSWRGACHLAPASASPLSSVHGSSPPTAGVARTSTSSPTPSAVGHGCG